MWDYVFSPHEMARDAAAGAIAFVVVRLLWGRWGRSFRDALVVMLTATVVRHLAFPSSQLRALPSGYVGTMVQICMEDAGRDACLCAVDALERDLGHDRVVQLGVKAEVNGELPTAFAEALDGCADGDPPAG